MRWNSKVGPGGAISYPSVPVGRAPAPGPQVSVDGAGTPGEFG
jgi:hypothetical protein